MTPDDGLRSRRRPPLRLFLGVLLLGVLASAVVLLGPGLLGSVRTAGGVLSSVSSECTVGTPGGTIGLDRDEAKLATTAVALAARGLEAPDTAGIDEAVLQQLADGPIDDAGPSLSCRGSAATDLPVEQLTASGLTPRAEQVREREFGRVEDGDDDDRAEVVHHGQRRQEDL